MSLQNIALHRIHGNDLYMEYDMLPKEVNNVKVETTKTLDNKQMIFTRNSLRETK